MSSAEIWQAGRHGLVRPVSTGLLPHGMTHLPTTSRQPIHSLYCRALSLSFLMLFLMPSSSAASYKPYYGKCAYRSTSGGYTTAVKVSMHVTKFDSAI